MKVLNISKFMMALTTLCATQAFAGGLFTPLSVDSTALLPKGVRNVRVGGFSTEVTDKFNGYGQIVPLGNSFNKNVTWNKLISARPLDEQSQLRGGLSAEGLDLNSVAGETRGLVNVRVTSTVPVIAYGLTEKITLGMGVPIVYSATHVDTGWSASEAANYWIPYLQQRGYEGRILALRNDLMNVVQAQILQMGYKRLEDDQQTGIGDVNLGLKYQVVSGPKYAFVIAPKLIVPTGRTADVDKVVDSAPGDGHFSTGASLISDFYVHPKFTITPSVYYLYKWASDQTVRVPRTGDESISPDKDYNVNVKKGDNMGAALAGKLQLTDVFGVASGYNYQYKNPDSYKGGAYAPYRYAYLEQDTWQSMHSGVVTLSASTVQLFKKKKFAVPLDSSLSYARVFDGRNVGKLDVFIFDLAAYF